MLLPPITLFQLQSYHTQFDRIVCLSGVWSLVSCLVDPLSSVCVRDDRRGPTFIARCQLLQKGEIALQILPSHGTFDLTYTYIDILAVVNKS